MDFWQKARSFAEEAAKRSQELTKEGARRSQEFTVGSSKISDLVSEASKRSKEIAIEASKRSKEIAIEASKRADLIKVEALKRADQIKSHISPPDLSRLIDSSPTKSAAAPVDLEKFGVTEELREFVKEITISTFSDFPMEDDSEMSDTPTVANVRLDLTEWQETHAKLVLSTVKEISKLRYELCPRIMKERKFWRIYFILVNSHVALYEKHYGEEKQKSAAVQPNVTEEIPTVSSVSKAEMNVTTEKRKGASAADQDLDAFLLGDLGDSDEGPVFAAGADEDFDEDFDKL